MARFRVESVEDITSGKFYNELFYPEDSEAPIATTEAVFGSLKEAEDAAVEALKSAMPEQSVRVV